MLVERAFEAHLLREVDFAEHRRHQVTLFHADAMLAGPLLLLVSGAGRYMTGSIVVVDGGHALGFL